MDERGLSNCKGPLSKLIKQPYQIDKADLSNCVDSIQDSKQLSKHISKGVIYPFQEKEFKEAWKIWIEERAANKYKKYTERAEQGALHKLQKISNHDYKTAITIINESISNGWRGLFALKESKQNSPELDIEETQLNGLIANINVVI